MTHIGVPILALDTAFTWCRLRTLHQQKCVCRTVHSGSAMADRKFIDEVVKAHNDYRKRHQAASLSHSKELSTQAQKWADHLASTGSFQHSSATLKGEKLGENIAMKWSSNPDAYTGQEVTDQWYGEVKMHVFGTEPATLRTGHFTQVVWKGSKEVGVGKAMTRDGKVIVVANYRPAGNMMRTFAANVLPPKDGKIVLPAEPAPERTTITTHFGGSSGGGGSGGGTFSQRFEDMRKDMFSGSQSSRMTTTGSRSESRSVRTYTVTEGVGANKVTKTITEETIIRNGEKTVNRKETITSGGTAPSSQSSHLQSDFGRLALKDHQGGSAETKTKQKKSKPFWKKRSSSSSSSDSSPERGGSGSKSKKTTAAAGKPQKMSDFRKDCLKAHNAKRALHGSGPLSLAADLSEHAQKWAEYLASNGRFEHSQCMVKGERVGENIACSWSSSGADYTGDQVVDQWYGEIKKHNFKADGSTGSGHFTQVVWKGSRELGVGKAQDGKGKVIGVCNYRPAGNLLGTYRDNVLPPK